MEDRAMRTTYDFAPLWRSTIGFDRLFDLVDAAQQAGTEDNYPPCNVERLGEDHYQISLAVAGFSPDEIAITAEQSVLTVEGRKAEKYQREFLYQGISSRPFKRQFSLADYVQVKGAAFDNGLLQIELVREIPEAMKPRRISIGGSSSHLSGRTPGYRTGSAGPRSTSTRRTRRCASPPNCPDWRKRTSASKSRTAFSRSQARRKWKTKTRPVVSASGTTGASNGAYRFRTSRRTRPGPRSRTAC